jgi:tetratricopeptide (TPR) repeat protein
MFYPFLPLDDLQLIKDRMILLMNPGNIINILFSPLYDQQALILFRPILNLSFMLDAIVGGGSEFIFHFSNLIYHLLSIILINILLTTFCNSKKFAGILTFIFAVHPINIHAVAWISGRNDILLAIIVFTSLITFHKFIVSTKNYWFFIHIILVFLSIYIKENAIVLTPLLILLLYQYRLDIFRKIIIVLSLTATCCLSLILRLNIVNFDVSFTDFTVLQFVSNTVFIIINYIGKFFIPVSYSVLPHLPDMSIYLGLISIVVILFCVFFTNRDNDKLFYIGILWFLLFLILPVIWSLSTGIGEFYEHRMYVPSFGILLSISQLRLKSSNQMVYKIGRSILISIISFLLVISSYRLKYYSDFNYFSKAAINESPSLARSYSLRGQYFHESGNQELAMEYYNQAINIRPNLYQILNSRGMIKLNTGNTKEAIEDFSRSIDLNHNYSVAHYNRGIAYFNSGLYFKSLSDYTTAISISPTNANYYNNRGFVFEYLEDYSSALQDYQKANLLLPGNQVIIDNINIVSIKLKNKLKTKH